VRDRLKTPGVFKKNPRGLTLFLVIFCIILFANTLGNSFIWDDRDLIVKNDYIKSPKNIPQLFSVQYWRRPAVETSGQYRPIRDLSFVLDYSLWGTNPSGFHYTNLVLHIINVLLVFYLVLMLTGAAGGVARPGIAFIAALLFAAHPIHTESIVWIKNRQDLLASMFLLSSFLLFARRKTGSDPVFLKKLGLTQFFFVLALFSKEIAICLPAVLVLYALVFLKKKDIKKAVVLTVPFFVMSGLFLAFKVFVLGGLVSAEHDVRLEVYTHALVILKTIGYYLWLLAFPFNLTAERIFAVPNSFFDPSVFYSILATGLCVFFAIRYRRARIFSFAIGWVLLTLLPASNIIFISGRPIAEQRLYIPSLGFCLLIAMAAYQLVIPAKAGIQRWRIGVPVLILIFYSATTIARNLDWRDPLEFWTKTLKSAPHSARPYNNLGTEYSARGEYGKAMQLYKKAISLDVRHVNSYYNIAHIYRDKGEYDKAIEFYKKTIELNPEYKKAYYNLAWQYTKVGDRDSAITTCPEADLYYNLANTYVGSGDYPQAIELYKIAIEISPQHLDAYNNLGNVYSDMGKYAKALKYYNRAIKITPDYARGYANISATYFRQKKYALAIEYCDKASSLGFSEPELLAALAPYRK